LISKDTILKDVFQTIFNRLKDQVTSVTTDAFEIFTVQTYTSSFPDSEIGNKSAYPILVLEPVELDWSPHTLTKKNANGRFTINIYCTNAEATDKFLDKIIDTIETYRDDLYALGLYFVDLESTNYDNVTREGFKVHLRSCIFSFIYRFTKTFP